MVHHYNCCLNEMWDRLLEYVEFQPNANRFQLKLFMFAWFVEEYETKQKLVDDFRQSTSNHIYYSQFLSRREIKCEKNEFEQA